MRRRLNLSEPLASAPPSSHNEPTERIISGVVTDAQGSAVPGATVTISNEATGVDTVLVTNAAGAYTSPPLVLGRYSVTVDLTGFKKAVTLGHPARGRRCRSATT